MAILFTDAFLYPARGSGWMMILLGSLFACLLQIGAMAPGIGLGVSVFSAGYFASFYFDIISSTIYGDNVSPDWPSFSDFTDDILLPFIRVIGAVIFSLLPLVISVLAINQDAQAFKPALALSVAFACLYFPMAILAIVLFGNLAAALPHIVLPAIVRCLPSYLVAVFELALVLAISATASEYAGKVFLAGWFLSAAVSLYFLMAQARLIGLLYVQNQERIGWA